MRPWPTRLATILFAAAALPGCRPAPAAKPAPPAEAPAPSGQELAQTAGAALIGKQAPALTLTTIDGQRIDLGTYYGKRPVYLKFWATWCTPCREQMPHFEGVQKARGGDIAVIAVDAGFNETPEAVRRYRQTMGLTMPVVIDDGRLADALRLRVTPEHIVIGRDGRIAYIGHLADARLERALDAAIAQAPGLAAAEPGHPAPLRPARVGDPAPALDLRAADGAPLRPAGADRPTVIAFFSPWCETYLAKSRPQMAADCRAAREQMTRLSSGSDVRWIGVAAGLWATSADLRDYTRDHKLTLPVALDDTGDVLRRFGVAQVPTFVAVGADGRIRRITPDAAAAVAAL